MNRLFWVLILLSLSACATSYEKCTKGDEWQRYGSLDSCVSIKEEERIHKRNAWAKWANEPMVTPQARRQQNCTSVVNGNFVNTSCN